MWVDLIKTATIEAEIKENLEWLFEIEQWVELVIEEIRKDIHRFLRQKENWKNMDWSIESAKKELSDYIDCLANIRQSVNRLLKKWDFKYK